MLLFDKARLWNTGMFFVLLSALVSVFEILHFFKVEDIYNHTSG